MEISRELSQEIQAIIEDTVQYFCDQHVVSGELAWILVECLATAKLAEIKGELAAV
tara:strand:- start:3677 stop:3844 length:168 start_codon:yes stop_codon:yes gene_type:complete